MLSLTRWTALYLFSNVQVDHWGIHKKFSLSILSLDQVKLRCQVDGNPTPAISWFKDGVPVAAVARPAHQPPYRSRGDQLRIAGLTHSDAGNFTCVADNEYGSIRKTFRVEVLGYLGGNSIMRSTQSPTSHLATWWRCEI